MLGCVAVPVFLAGSTWFSLRMVREWNQANPGLLELNGIL
jgi:hypothetical protein